MITFVEARRLAVNYMARWYPLESSAYAAETHGWGDETHWHVRVGDFRYIVEGDQRFRREGTPLVAVDKRTGEVSLALPGPRQASDPGQASSSGASDTDRASAPTTGPRPG